MNKPSIPMTNDDINTLVIEMRDLESQIKALEKSVDDIKDWLKEDMTSKGEEEISTGMFILRYKNVDSSRFDSKRFKAEHSDLYESYCNTTSAMRFTVK